MPDQAVADSLTLSIERKDDIAVVRCSGKLVSGVTSHLQNKVSALIPDCKRIILDLTNLTRMDSMGLGTVVRLYVSAKSSGCCLELVNLSTGIRHLLGVTNLLSVLTTMCEQGISLRF